MEGETFSYSPCLTRRERRSGQLQCDSTMASYMVLNVWNGKEKPTEHL